MTAKSHYDEDTAKLLRKGLEEEVFTGHLNGEVVGLSARIAADLPGFATEPDARNVEYTTAPYRDYQILIDRLMAKRCRLRRYLYDLDRLTLVPSSTLALETRDTFQISNQDNPYYRFISETYGLTVVTASTHINVGLDDPKRLLRACRVLRCEAPFYLALTAASPFLKGELTGFHSTRWRVFPVTPEVVPFFVDHESYIDWMESAVKNRQMYNHRHLWLSVRPNGPATPFELNRLELRICDRISRPALLAGVIALLEASIWQVLDDPDLDPLDRHDEATLQSWCRENEQAVATSSLEAEMIDWRTGKRRPVRELLLDKISACREFAATRGFSDRLDPLLEVIDRGNLAMLWIEWCKGGLTPSEVIERSIAELTAIDREYDPECPSPA